jgi:hypothetical protein
MQYIYNTGYRNLIFVQGSSFRNAVHKNYDTSKLSEDILYNVFLHTSAQVRKIVNSEFTKYMNGWVQKLSISYASVGREEVKELKHLKLLHGHLGLVQSCTYLCHLAKFWFLHDRAGSNPATVVLFFESQRDQILWLDQCATESSQEDIG